MTNHCPPFVDFLHVSWQAEKKSNFFCLFREEEVKKEPKEDENDKKEEGNEEVLYKSDCDLVHIMCGYQCDKAVNKNDTREVI